MWRDSTGNGDLSVRTKSWSCKIYSLGCVSKRVRVGRATVIKF